MFASILPITSRIRTRFKVHAFEDEATERWEVAPAVKRWSAAAPCLPDDPERIFDQDSATAEETRVTLTARTVSHEATTLLRFRNVHVIDGVLYARRAYLPVTDQSRRSIITTAIPSLPSALVCTNYTTQRYFGHWLIDGLILEETADEQKSVPLTFAPRRWMHEDGYRGLLDRHDRPMPIVRVTDCLTAEDRGLNDYWIRRVEILRARLRRSVASSGTTAPVFLTRGTGGKQRQMLNEDDVRQTLDQRGFRIVEPEKLSPVELAAAIVGAPLIVAVEGSHQAHAILAAQQGSSMVTIMPPRRANAYHKNHADALGIGWAYTVADDRGEGEFHQSIDRLLRVIDLADTARQKLSR